MKPASTSVPARGAPSDWLINALAARGITIERIATALQLDPNIFQQKADLLDVRTFDRLYEWAAKELNDPDLGIHIAQEAQPSWFGLMGYISRNAPTLEEAFKSTAQYHRLYSPEFGLSYCREGDFGVCAYQESSSVSRESRQDTSFAMGTIVETVHLLVDSHWIPQKCTFTYSPPEDLTEHYKHFGRNLFFRQPQNKVLIEGELLAMPVSEADPSLLRIVTQQANQLLEESNDEPHFLRHIQFLIAGNIGNDALNFESLARELNMSVRSLHRHLQKHNTTFRRLRHDAVLKISKEALLHTNVSVTEIALRLGYSELSVFVRLFKRLVGDSPLQYRKKSGVSA